MTTQHTPGKLKLTFGKELQWDYMLDAQGEKSIAYFRHYKPMTKKEGKANARRLVACWNALEGLSTGKIDAIAAIGGFPGAVGELMAQRDELLAALTKTLEEGIGWFEDSTGQDPSNLEWVQQAREAITKAQA